MTLPIGEYRPVSRLALGRALVVSLLLHFLLLVPEPASVRLWSAAGRPGLQATLNATPLPSSSLAPTPAPPVAPLLPGAGPVMAAQNDPVSSASVDRPGSGGNVTPGTETSDGAVDAESLRGYRMALALQARRYWRYPEAARQAGWQGMVELRVMVLPSGGTSVAIVRGSGYGSLDDAALATVRQPAMAAELPASLRGSHFSFVVPVSFSRE